MQNPSTKKTVHTCITSENEISWGIERFYFSYNLFCVFNVVFDQIWDILHLHEKRWNLIKMQCKILPPRRLYIPVLPVKMNMCSTCSENHQHTTCQHNDEERSLTGTWVGYSFLFVVVSDVPPFIVFALTPLWSTAGFLLHFVLTEL
jgi:hypothetical protein